MTDLKEGELKDWVFFEDHLIKYAECLIAADEIAKAHVLLRDFIPSFYRDFPTHRLQIMRDEVQRFLTNSLDYSTNAQDQNVTVEVGRWMLQNNLRGQLVLADVKALNEKEIEPYILEMGPGEYWFPIGLKDAGCKFKYSAIGLNDVAQTKARELLGDCYLDRKLWPPREHRRVNIYLACEIIEHLWFEEEIRQNLVKTNTSPEIIHISTPRYTPHDGVPTYQWRSNPGGGSHLRIYTPKEFQQAVVRIFPEYQWQHFDNKIQHMRGLRMDIAQKASEEKKS